VRVVDEFLDTLGAEAANAALRHAARGGVYIVGGELPMLGERIHDGRIVQAYLARSGTAAEVVKQCPLWVTIETDLRWLGAHAASMSLLRTTRWGQDRCDLKVTKPRRSARAKRLKVLTDPNNCAIANTLANRLSRKARKIKMLALAEEKQLRNKQILAKAAELKGFPEGPGRDLKLAALEVARLREEAAAAEEEAAVEEEEVAEELGELERMPEGQAKRVKRKHIRHTQSLAMEHRGRAAALRVEAAATADGAGVDEAAVMADFIEATALPSLRDDALEAGSALPQLQRQLGILNQERRLRDLFVAQKEEEVACLLEGPTKSMIGTALQMAQLREEASDAEKEALAAEEVTCYSTPRASLCMTMRATILTRTADPDSPSLL